MYKRIKDLREDHDLTQKDISNYLNVYRSTYAKWEDGNNKIPLLMLDKLSIKYNVSIDYMLSLSNIKKDYVVKPLNIDLFLLRLRQERKNKNLSQLYIADILNLTKSTYNKYELGIVIPSIDKIITLSKFYKVSMDYLLGKKDERITKQDNN